MKSAVFACVLGWLLALGSLVLPAPRVRACSCAAEPIHTASPADGATDVPIDFVPVIEGSFRPSDVSLETEAGHSVAITLRVGPGHHACQGTVGELVPSAPLETDTTYVIRAGSDELADEPAEIRFTTGSASVEQVTLVKPVFTASFIEGNLIGDSCLSDLIGCIFVDGEGQFEVTMRDAQDRAIVRTLVEGGASVTVESLYTELPTCVDVRARDAAGRFSEATTQCRDDLLIRDAAESDWEGFDLVCTNGVIGRRGEGEPTAGVDGGVDGGDSVSDAGSSAPDASVPVDPGSVDDGGTMFANPQVQQGEDDDAPSGAPASSSTSSTSGGACTATGSRSDASWLATGLALLVASARRRAR